MRNPSRKELKRRYGYLILHFVDIVDRGVITPSFLLWEENYGECAHCGKQFRYNNKVRELEIGRTAICVLVCFDEKACDARRREAREK